MPAHRIPLEPGALYGHWTVLWEGRTRNRQRYAVARCRCGGVHEVRFSSLRLGKSTRCTDCAAADHGVKITRHYLSDGRRMVDVAEEHGIPPSTAQRRIWLGWPVDKAATVPVNGAMRA